MYYFIYHSDQIIYNSTVTTPSPKYMVINQSINQSIDHLFASEHMDPWKINEVK